MANGASVGAGMSPNMLMMMQMLSAAGQDIGAGNPIGANVNAVTQQNVKNEAFKTMMQELMAGNVPGSSTTVDDKGTKIQLAPAGKAESGLTGAGIGTQQNSMLAGMLSSMLGGGTSESAPFPSSLPSSSGGIDWSKIPTAGLTPETMLAGMKMAQSLKPVQMTAKDLADLNYKRQLTAESKAREGQIGVEAATKEQQNYEYAVENGYKGTFNAFINQPNSFDEYSRAKDGGYEGTYPEWLTKMSALTKGDKGYGQISWSQTYTNLRRTYTTEDKEGQYNVTPENQGRWRLARRKLSEIEKEGGINPQKAAIMAENYVEKVQDVYYKRIQDANDIENKQDRIAKIKDINRDYKLQFRYLPSGPSKTMSLGD